MRKITFTLLVSILLVIAAPYAGHSQSFSDAEIKAAYLFKLAKFITWNGERKAPIKFCYIESLRTEDDASVGQSFKRLVKARDAQDQWSVSRIRGLNGINSCDVLFIADSEDSSLSSILLQVGDSNILTASDIRRFIFKGGMLGFETDDQGRIKMEGNLSVMKTANVMLSAVVLELMKQVIK